MGEPLGRSRPFWRLPEAQARFRSFRRCPSKPSSRAQPRRALPIRVEADEVTYNLHIVLRTELELELCGKASSRGAAGGVERVEPEAAGARARRTTEGVLQDIHWASGEFGYFPTYALGNLYAASFMRAAERALPALWEAIARGDFLPLRSWLRTRVHAEGARARRRGVGAEGDGARPHRRGLRGLFINGESISGNPLGLRIAAGNVPNLVDPVTGGWGKVILDPLNSTQTTTLANLNTLGSLISRLRHRGRRRLACPLPQGRNPDRRSDAQEHPRGDGRHRPHALGRSEGALRVVRRSLPAAEGRLAAQGAVRCRILPMPRPTSPSSLCFAGGGIYATGKFCSMQKATSGAARTGCPARSPASSTASAAARSSSPPMGRRSRRPITGFTGMGVDGVGWGTAVTHDKVWVTGFNGKIGVMDFDGRPIGKESDFPFAGKLGGLMGVGVAANGDVWIADGTKNQLLYFPGGRMKDGRLVQVKGLKSPFGIAIDAQNRVWVSNSQSDTVVRFPADDPSKVESFRAGIGVRGVALDSKGNLWVASNMSLDFPPPKIPDGVSIMKQFQIAGRAHVEVLTPAKTTGVINMIRPDGTQPAPMGFTGGGRSTCRGA